MTPDGVIEIFAVNYQCGCPGGNHSKASKPVAACGLRNRNLSLLFSAPSDIDGESISLQHYNFLIKVADCRF